VTSQPGPQPGSAVPDRDQWSQQFSSGGQYPNQGDGFVPTGGLGGAGGNAGGVAVEGKLAAAVNFGSSNVTIFVRRGNAMAPTQMIKTSSQPVSVAFGRNHLVVLGLTTAESFPVYGNTVGTDNDGVVQLARADKSAAQIVTYDGGAVYSEKSGSIAELNLSTNGMAGLSGPHGVQKMSVLEIGLIFPVLAILVWMGAVLCVAEAIPGSRRPLTPWLLAISGCIALAGVFGLLFRDYRTERFVSQGMTCLIAGLGLALPASLAVWWFLRRGFAVNSVAAGLANGTLAGLAGVTMLELHCPNFEAPHVMFWHIAVLPVSGAIGRLVAWTARAYCR